MIVLGSLFGSVAPFPLERFVDVALTLKIFENTSPFWCHKTLERAD